MITLEANVGTIFQHIITKFHITVIIVAKLVNITSNK